jgi:hypothetical protein
MCIHLRQLQLFAVLGGTLEHDLSQLVVPRLRAGIVHAAKEVLHGCFGCLARLTSKGATAITQGTEDWPAVANEKNLSTAAAAPSSEMKQT